MCVCICKYKSLTSHWASVLIRLYLALCTLIAMLDVDTHRRKFQL